MLVGLGNFIEAETTSSAPSTINAEAVTFDGSINDRLVANTPFSSNATYSCLLFSAWLYPRDLANYQGVLTVSEGSASSIDSIIQIMNSGTIRFYNGDNGISIASSGLTLNTWQHVMFSLEWNNVCQIYINDVKDSETITGNFSFNPSTNDDVAVGCRVAFNNEYDGDLSEIWFDYSNTFYDLDITSNRRKFISSDGKPVDLGSDGSNPTGNQPLICFSGDATVWNNGDNKGSLTGFSAGGDLTDATTEPVEI